MTHCALSPELVNGLTVAEAAVAYTRSGLKVVPVPHRGKQCFLDGWTTLDIPAADLPKHFPAGRPMNVGGRVGEPSGGLLDVDVDCPEAKAAAAVYLPVTTWVSGHAGNPESHFWYTATEAVATDQLKDLAGKMLIELRSTGAQTVLPPSVHEDGHKVVWHRLSGIPIAVSGPDLRVLVRRIAAAALIARHWPDEGGRHQASLALAGGLCRAGWPETDVESFVIAVADAAGDDESRRRARNVAGTAAKVKDDKHTTGWPTLAKVLRGEGSRVVDLALEWLGLRIPEGAFKKPAGSTPDPWADPIPLSDDPDVPAFPLGVFPPKLAAFAGELAWAMNAPPDFVGLAVLTLAAGAVGNARHLHLSTVQNQPALIYGALVGLPGTVKSPVLKHLAAPFDAIQARWNDEYDTAMGEWEAKNPGKRKGKKAEPVDEIDGDEGEARGEKPQLRMLIARNFTFESLALALHQNPRGIVAPFDELTALFSGLNQYKGGGGNDRQSYLSIWAQETLQILRKSDMKDGIPPIWVQDPCVSIIGGIQPDLLAAIRGKTSRRGEVQPDDGGLDRFLFVWPKTRPEVGEEGRTVSPGLMGVWPGVVKRLVEDLGDDGAVRFSRDGAAAWMAFTSAHAGEVNDPDFEEHLRGPWVKLKAYCARLTLALHLLWWAADGGDWATASADSVRRAAKLVAYFKVHARKVHAAIGADPRVNLARKVLRWVRQTGATRFTQRDAYRACRGTVKTVDVLEPILALLVSHNIIRPEAEADRPGRGRKPSQSYEVNPAYLPAEGGTGTEHDDEAGTNSGHSGHHESRHEGGDSTEGGDETPPDSGQCDQGSRDSPEGGVPLPGESGHCGRSFGDTAEAGGRRSDSAECKNSGHDGQNSGVGREGVDAAGSEVGDEESPDPFDREGEL